MLPVEHDPNPMSSRASRLALYGGGSLVTMASLALYAWGGLTTTPLLGGGGLLDVVPAVGGNLGPDTVYWCSDWSDGIVAGNAWSDVTLADFSGKCVAQAWSGLTAGLATDSLLEVRTTATDGRDYPSTFYLRMYCCRSGDNVSGLAFGVTDNYVPAPEQGDTVVVRWYQRVVTDTTTDPNLSSHGMYFDTAAVGFGWGPQTAGFQWQFDDFGPGVGSPPGDTIMVSVAASPADTAGGSGQVWLASRTSSSVYGIPAGQTIRVELLYARVDRVDADGIAQALPAGNDSTWFVSARVYDINDSLIIPETGWRGRLWSNFDDTLIAHVRDRTIPSKAGHRAQTGFKLHVEGIDDTGGGFRDIIEICCVAIGNGWLGPYPIAGVEN